MGMIYRGESMRAAEDSVMEKSLKNRASSRKQIFIVEDHPAFREGLAQLLGAEEGLEICGQAGSAEEALQEIARLKPDLVLVDISLPGKSGLELIKELRALNRKLKLLVVSMHDEALYAARVLGAGGDGYIMKQEDTEEILCAIQDVLAGHIYVSEQVVDGVRRKVAGKAKIHRLDELTDYELEVLELLGRGQTNEDIAKVLGLRTGKVAAHCDDIQRKLKLASTNALIRYAVCWVESAGR
jgi:DNA-binding NarL/FixJ family response regulator